MPSRVTWQVDDSRPATLVRLAGTLDLGNAESVRNTLNACLAAQPDALVLDLRTLTVADRRALPIFTAAARQAAEWPGIPVMLWRTEDDRTAPGPAAVSLSGGRQRRSRQVRLRLQPVAGACRRARDFARDGCERWNLPSLAGPVSVVLSELVTNVVRHARTPMDVRLTLRAPYLHVAVADGHPGMPRPGHPGPTAEGGRGLLLVRSLTQRWGFLPVPQGKVVWATLGTT
jgi:Histidine kinase-like ATPase domain